ncbi:hypothetical protein [Levilactobacillus yonginensis]
MPKKTFKKPAAGYLPGMLMTKKQIKVQAQQPVIPADQDRWNEYVAQLQAGRKGKWAFIIIIFALLLLTL